MEKKTPARKPHTSTADLLTWPENPNADSPGARSSAQSHQPSDGISKAVFGGQVTDEEAESLNKRVSGALSPEDAGNEEDNARDKKGKMASEKWTNVQEEALAKAWVHCSTNKKKGNQQNRESFWRKILDHFNATVGGSNRTVHQVRSKWTPMMTKINFFNGLYQQADRTRENGCKDLDVMKVALKEFKERYPNGFQHVEAWEVVRKHDKWAQVPLLGEEGEGSAQKRKPVDVHPSIPGMNEDPSPQRTQRRDKRQATSSEGSSAELAAQFKEYTAMKEAKYAMELEAIELRKKRESEARELISEQRETMKNYNYDRDMKTFLKPHDHAPPNMLPFILARKRDIANKYGWPCDF